MSRNVLELMLEPVLDRLTVRDHVPRSGGYDALRADRAPRPAANAGLLGRVLVALLAVAAFLSLTLWTAVWLVLELL